MGSVTKGIEIARDELRISNSNLPHAKREISSMGRGEKITNLAAALMVSACC